MSSRTDLPARRAFALKLVTGACALAIGGLLLLHEPPSRSQQVAHSGRPWQTAAVKAPGKAQVLNPWAEAHSPFAPAAPTDPAGLVATRTALRTTIPVAAPQTDADAPPSAADSSQQGGVQAPAGLKEVDHPRLFAVQVDPPADTDADGLNTSAAMPPVSTRVPESLLRIPSRGSLTSAPGEGSGSSGLGDVSAAAGATAVVSVYTPAQIRQAYGFAALPAGTVANKSAYQGSGQIIVIVDAYHNATAGSDLNAFSVKFGLPSCTLTATTFKAGTPISSIVSPPKPGDGCSFQTVYTTSAGTQSATAPAVNSSWQMESALDVQWAHAIAPMAKIVLVEAPSSAGSDLINALNFASKLNASTVSMSFGAPEFSGMLSTDAYMVGTATWVASSGDNGAGVNWPAASKNVLSVGGTLLSNVSPRAETAWSGSGGGLSLYEPMPTWQSAVAIPGNPTNTAANASKMRRGVPDVGYNASPNSGVYVYSGGNWWSVGGTSAGTPQWAAFVVIVNSVRVLNGKPAFSGTGFQTALYGSAAAAANYKASFLDVTTGSNGTCKTCLAVVGYDLVTGLGSPNIASLVNTLTALQ